MTDIAHTAFPLRYADGRPVTVEQDSPHHMRDRVHVTALTPLGDMLHDPTFGIPAQLLNVREVDVDQLAAALTQSEPDIAITVGRVQDGATGLSLPNARDDSIRIDVDEED